MTSSSSTTSKSSAISASNSEWKKITQKDIAGVRSRLLKKQRGICPICKNEVKDPNLDHDHKTGAVRDVLCRNCNRVEGKILHWVRTVPGDNVEILRRLARYWIRHNANRHGLIHPGKTTKRKRRRKRK